MEDQAAHSLGLTAEFYIRPLTVARLWYVAAILQIHAKSLP
jgi:hypothetical protein